MSEVWLYLRKSRALDPNEDPEKLLAAHRAALERRIAADGIALPEDRLLQEKGSADTIAGRPVFAALLKDWERLPRDHGGIVYVMDIDRLSRGDMGEQSRVQKALARANIQVRTPSREYDLRDVDEGFHFEVEALFARRELQVYRKRVARKWEELRRDGRSVNLIGPCCYVRDANIKNWVPHPVNWVLAQAWCREIYTMSGGQIARKYGVPRTTVIGLLRDPAIAGFPVQKYELHHGERAIKSKMQPIPRHRWKLPVKQGDYPPLISWEEFQRIQVILDQRRCRRAPSGTSDNAWCKDVVRFTSHPDRTAELGTDPNFALDDPGRWTYKVEYNNRRSRVWIGRPVIHHVAVAILRPLLARTDLMRQALANYHDEQASDQRTASPADIERQISELRDKLQRTVSAEMSATGERAHALRAVADKTERDLEAMIEALQHARQPVLRNSDLELCLARLEGGVERWSRIWEDDVPGEVVRGVVAATIQVIWVETARVPGQRALRREVVDYEYRYPWRGVIEKGKGIIPSGS